MPLSQTAHCRTPRQTRSRQGNLLCLHSRRLAKGKLTLVSLIVWLHGQRQSHVLRKKGLCRNLARVDAYRSTARLFQEPTSLDMQALAVSYRAVLENNVVDCAVAHEPCASNPGCPCVHASRELKIGKQRGSDCETDGMQQQQGLHQLEWIAPAATLSHTLLHFSVSLDHQHNVNKVS
jgi:hypothetical protein